MKQMRFRMLHKLLMLLFTLSSSLYTFAGWNSFIVNFDKNLYGKGAQTWQIAPYDDKWVYFANKNGMLQFDGNIWSVFPINNGSDVRSVLVSATQKKIYAGGINEFGYYEPGTDGSLVYHCMSDTLDASCRSLGNVWGIHETDNILYFQGDDRVVKYLNGRYTAIGMNAKIDCSNMVNGILYIGTDHGVWFLVGNTFFPLQGADILASKRIRGIISYKNGILVATAYNGLYYCDGKTVQPLVTGAELKRKGAGVSRMYFRYVRPFLISYRYCLYASFPVRLSYLFVAVNSVVAQFFLDAQQLVVLRHAV